MALPIGDIWDYQNQPQQGSDVNTTDPTSYLGQLSQTGFNDLESYFSGGGGLAGLGAGALGTFGGNELGSLFGNQSGLGSDIGGGVGSLAGMAFGPLGSLAGGVLGSLLGGELQSLIGGGVPTGAKTSGTATSLEGSGSPLLELLGSYIQGAGGGSGSNVLSNPAFAKQTNTFADILSWLSGQALPGYQQKGSTGEITGIPAAPGSGYSKPTNIMGIQSPQQLFGELGASPNLSPAQIQGLLPQIQQLISGGGSLSSLAPALKKLGTSAGAAGTTGGPNAGAFGGGPLAALSSLTGGGDELASILQAALAQRQGGGAAAASPWDQVIG